MQLTTEPPVQRVARATFLAGEAECGVCGAWVCRVPTPVGVRPPAVAQAKDVVVAECGVCGLPRFFELL